MSEKKLPEDEWLQLVAREIVNSTDIDKQVLLQVLETDSNVISNILKLKQARPDLCHKIISMIKDQ